MQVRGVLVVAPLGVISLAWLLRTYLIEMAKANVVREKRAAVAQSLLKFITSPQFKNPIEDVIRLSTELQDMITQEFKDHYRGWQKRWTYYNRIQWDSTQVGANIELVLQNKAPRPILYRKAPPLQLPRPN